MLNEGRTMLAKGPASRFPVSKSRLEACGSSVPRPRTAPSAHPEKPKAMGAELSSSTAESSSKLEQEYIYRRGRNLAETRQLSRLAQDPAIVTPQG